MEAVLSNSTRKLSLFQNYQNADCSLRKKLLCHLLYFLAHFRSLFGGPDLSSEGALLEVLGYYLGIPRHDRIRRSQPYSLGAAGRPRSMNSMVFARWQQRRGL